MRALFLLLLLLSFVAGPALAGDGVLEINQTCATESGCFSGDPPGLPVEIVNPGSYLLTSSILLPDGDTNGIVISSTSNDVSLDLNGFGILGPVVCINYNCTGGGSGTTSGFGILVSSGLGGGRSIQISNGFVRGAGSSGIYAFGGGIIVSDLIVESSRASGVTAGPNSIVQRTMVASNGSFGIDGGTYTSILDSRAFYNGNIGIYTGAGGSIRNCISGQNESDGYQLVRENSSPLGGGLLESSTARANLGRGVYARRNSRIANSTFHENVAGGIEVEEAAVIVGNTVTGGAFGIDAGTDSKVAGNQVSGSIGHGISVSTSSHVKDNLSSSHDGNGILTGNASTIHDNTANSNLGHGIEAGTGSNVRGNTARSNSGFGLQAESLRVRFSDNSFTNNNGGESAPQTSSGFDAGNNLCNTSATCP